MNPFEGLIAVMPPIGKKMLASGEKQLFKKLRHQ